MDQTPRNNPLVERILQSPTRLVLLRGPAASGKTTAAMEIYRRHLDDGARPRCLILAPNTATLEAVKRRLLNESPSGILIHPQVMTFSSLAGRILAAAGNTAPMLSGFKRRMLLRGIVDDLIKKGKLFGLAAVSDTAGIILSLDRAIAELKRSAVDPEQLARAVNKNDPRSCDLVSIYHRYQSELQAAGNFDVEGRMWAGRDVLARTAPDEPIGGLEGIGVLVADGFTDFTPTQLEMLALLGSRLEKVVITLAYCDDGRERMWAWTRRTLERIRQELSGKLTEVTTEPTDSSLRAAWDHLFEIAPPQSGFPDGLRIIAAPGPEGEVLTAARRIKRLLKQGARCGDIAVLVRSDEVYRPLVERVFKSFEIALTRGGEMLSDVPAVRFLFDVATIAPRFIYRDVLRVISSSYFRPESLGEYGQDEVAAAQMLVREGNVLEGRESYVSAVERIINRAPPRGGEDEDLNLGVLSFRPEVLESAGRMLTALFDLAAASENPAGLLALINALELRKAALSSGDEELIARDLRSIEQLSDLLRTSASPAANLGQIREALALTTSPPPRGESLVDFLDVLDARAMRYKHVFLLGLTEGQFPKKPRESSLIRHSDRLSWSERGVQLDTRDELTLREMLLFYLSLSRANESLTITYQQCGPEGEPTGLSGFLLSALEAMGGLDGLDNSGHLEKVAPGSFTPPPDEIASEREAFNTAISGLFTGKNGEAACALTWALAAAQDKILRCSRGLIAWYHRYLPGTCDRFDGRISDPQLLEDLSERFTRREVFSPSGLNSYGQCPWSFFALRVLKLQALRVPQRRIEPVDRGVFVHDVMFRVMSDLRKRCTEPLRLSKIAEADLLETLERALKGASERIERTRPPYPLLWKIQNDSISRSLRDYLLKERGNEGAEQAYFELGFGVEDVPEEALDPNSISDPVTIETPTGNVRIRGKIDRIDRLHQPERALLVIDYKTGLLPGPTDINQGRSLQLPIYTEAVARIFDEDALGGAFHQVFKGTERHFSQIKPDRGDPRSFEQRRQDAAALIGRFVGAMADGRFDALPTRPCPRYCPFRRICHFSPARADLKQRPASAAQRQQGTEDPR